MSPDNGSEMLIDTLDVACKDARCHLESARAFTHSARDIRREEDTDSCRVTG